MTADDRQSPALLLHGVGVALEPSLERALVPRSRAVRARRCADRVATPQNPIGWLFLAFGLARSSSRRLYASAPARGSLPGGDVAASWSGTCGIRRSASSCSRCCCSPTAACSRGWRWVAGACVDYAGLAVAGLRLGTHDVELDCRRQPLLRRAAGRSASAVFYVLLVLQRRRAVVAALAGVAARGARRARSASRSSGSSSRRRVRRLFAFAAAARSGSGDGCYGSTASPLIPIAAGDRDLRTGCTTSTS